MTWPFDNRIADCTPAQSTEIPERSLDERAAWLKNALSQTVCPFSMGHAETKPCVGSKCMLFQLTAFAGPDQIDWAIHRNVQTLKYYGTCGLLNSR